MKRTSLFFGAILLATATMAQPIMPDSSFGTNGRVQTTWTGKHSAATSMALQADDKIVAAGYVYDATTKQACLLRYNANGSTDNSFGTQGQVLVSMAAPQFDDVLIQSDDKIVAAGNDIYMASTTPILFRYNADGTPDVSFGSNGQHPLGILMGMNSSSLSAAIQLPDGRLVLGGNTMVNVGGNPLMTLVCLKPNGQYDSSFGTNGMARYELEPGNASVLYCLAVQADGKILAGGYTGTATLIAPPDTRMGIIRIKPTDGTPDSSFGTNGIVALNLTPSATNPLNIAQTMRIIPPTGNILVGGNTQGHMAMVELKPDGSKDTYFNQGGVLTDPALPPVDAISLNPDMAITAAGMQQGTQPGTTDIILTRYYAKGTPDPTFGTAGKMMIDQGNDDKVYDMREVGGIGKLLMAGHTDIPGGNEETVTLWKYKIDPSGIDDTYLPQASIYPNPAHGLLTIDLGTAPTTAIPAQLADVTGKVLIRTSLTSTKQQLDVSTLAAGTYILQLGEGTQTRSMKLTVL